jgi:nicotinamide phosphoribosyltransferase
MIEEFGTGVFACVMDSYDYVFALEKVLPSVSSYKLEKGGFMVLRPDSGDPIETVLQALRAAEKVFDSTKNSKGFKVLRGCSVIQGDGVNYQTISQILDAALKEGYSAQNIAFGMGGGLLQKVNRDTMSFATKLSHIKFADRKERDIMKTPKTDTGKTSLPGTLSVCINEEGLPVVVPKESVGNRKVYMETVYDNGKVKQWDNFTTVRNRLEEQWKKYPKHLNVISDELKSKVASVRSAQDLRMKEMFKEFN